MTTSAVTSADVSWLIGPQSSPTSTRPSEVVHAEFAAPRPLPLPATCSLDHLVARTEAVPDRAAALRSARARLAEELTEHKPLGLSRLRLRAGLSQAQLAQQAGTSQAHVARIESGKNDPGTSVVARIASALGVSETEAFVAIRADQINGR